MIRGDHGTFVMDTGFDHAMAAKRGRVIVKPVAEGLAAIGVDPERVQDVIISHLHYDHCGTTTCFRARAITCRIAKWPTAPDDACVTRTSGFRLAR